MMRTAREMVRTIRASNEARRLGYGEPMPSPVFDRSAQGYPLYRGVISFNGTYAGKLSDSYLIMGVTPNGGKTLNLKLRPDFLSADCQRHYSGLEAEVTYLPSNAALIKPLSLHKHKLGF